MKDARGIDLDLGDSILFTYWHQSDMYRGKIVRITPNTIVIKSKYYGTYSIRKSNVSARVVKI